MIYFGNIGFEESLTEQYYCHHYQNHQDMMIAQEWYPACRRRLLACGLLFRNGTCTYGTILIEICRPCLGHCRGRVATAFVCNPQPPSRNAEGRSGRATPSLASGGDAGFLFVRRSRGEIGSKREMDWNATARLLPYRVLSRAGKWIVALDGNAQSRSS